MRDLESKVALDHRGGAWSGTFARRSPGRDGRPHLPLYAAVAASGDDDYVATHASDFAPPFQQPWPQGDYRLFQLGFVIDDIFKVATQWARIHGSRPILCPSCA